MSSIECNYQRKVTAKEYSAALAEAQCSHCGISSKDLMRRGELLEVCGEELYSDIASGERVLIPIALCPSCHRRHHQDAQRMHNPCQIKARHSRECLE
ncbi:hypothetical protein FGK63_04625 [Ruegeria sediminis]|uniref:HNH endonuclease n=2 Tax=Ruegeria sediminis TaxID=2583820 RepID=A0ABY2X5H1_9RHOB|nr:hypothetical protein FGK63_04625 [Ruegeria sediminis]